MLVLPVTWIDLSRKPFDLSAQCHQVDTYGSDAEHHDFDGGGVLSGPICLPIRRCTACLTWCTILIDYSDDPFLCSWASGLGSELL
jgi:hypothetical protein